MTCLLVLGITRAHLVIRLRFYGGLKTFPVFAVLIGLFLVQILKQIPYLESDEKIHMSGLASAR